MTSPDRKAVIIGASGGIGAALSACLLDRGFQTLPLSRSAGDIDFSDETSIARAATRAGIEVEILIVATGALEGFGSRPERSFSEVTAESLLTLYQANAVGPALVYKHFAPRLKKQGRTVTAFLSARLGSIGDNRLGGWMGYRASKSALNQIVKCAAIEGARSNPGAVALCLHPGTIETRMTRRLANGRFTATPDECAQMLMNIILSADASQNGAFLDYKGLPVPW